MMNDADKILITMLDGSEYELILTTNATRIFVEKYGGLEKLGEALLEETDQTTKFREVVYIISVLANQSVLINNMLNPENKKPEITEDMVNLLTTPFHFQEYNEKLIAVMRRDMTRNIKSEEPGDDEKNEPGA